MIGNLPLKERIILTSGPLEYELKTDPDDGFPDDTEATLYIYSKDWLTELGFWPLTVLPGLVRVSVTEEDVAALPSHCRFRIYVTYPGEARRPWYEGTALRVTA
jgi:hypothetical protein